MKKPLVFSLTASILLATNINAQSMYEKFQEMQTQIELLQSEVIFLKQQTALNNDSDPQDEDLLEDENKEDKNEEQEVSEDEEDDLEETLEYFDAKISKLNKATSGNHLKLSADYRFSLDHISYKMANGDEINNDSFMSNRLWINTFYKANNQLSFRAQLAYQKAFGSRSGTNATMADPAYNGYENFDWITNENAYDGQIRLKSTYFLYKNDTFAGLDLPWTFSIGRRPSTNGHLIHLREDDSSSSPMGHTINVEFDGLSSKFTLFQEWGTYVKLCAGRGLSNADVKFSPTPYAKTSDIPDIDLLGLIFVPYNDGHYSFNTQFYYANNLIDMKDPNANNKSMGFETVGGLSSASANFIAQGIGHELSDFLDESLFFVSGAYTKTDPKEDKSMLGSSNQEEGYSYWIGVQFPSLISNDGKWGFEFNHASQYFRSITYAEDTNIGSKVAARGNAYEAYFTQNLIKNYLSMQIRFTHIDYKYTGSNGFFGSTSGRSMNIDKIKQAANAGDTQAKAMLSNVVDKAQDIRFYLRYRY